VRRSLATATAIAIAIAIAIATAIAIAIAIAIATATATADEGSGGRVPVTLLTAGAATVAGLYALTAHETAHVPLQEPAPSAIRVPTVGPGPAVGCRRAGRGAHSAG
jgi:hypothetical protein